MFIHDAGRCEDDEKTSMYVCTYLYLNFSTASAAMGPWFSFTQINPR